MPLEQKRQSREIFVENSGYQKPSSGGTKYDLKP